jgi:pimeloyl-ACP methyl ester carboxylesterase
MKRVRANGLDFAYVEQGEGPLVLLLHGFPDTAMSWGHQIPALAAAGYRAVAPYLRGYSPTEIPRDGFYDKATLATDVAELIRALGGGPAHLIGQDWGATIGYAFRLVISGTRRVYSPMHGTPLSVCPFQPCPLSHPTV